MTEMASARGANDLIKTRRKYIRVGSDRSVPAAHGLVRPLAPLTDALKPLHHLPIRGRYRTGHGAYQPTRAEPSNVTAPQHLAVRAAGTATEDEGNSLI